MTAASRPTFKRFELLSRLGSGLHGRVYLAWDPQLERKVALKVLTRQRDSKATLDQFFAEARAVAKVAHANVVPLFEVGAEKGLPYLVFEYVDGAPLKEYLKTTVLDFASACSQFLQIADGVAAAHAAGIAHLDLSPNNVLVDGRGTLRVMDFGLSRFVERAKVVDADDDVQGTPRYMSPEHFTGAPLDLRTDVFALGLVFFEMLTGRPAGNASKLRELTTQIRTTRFDWHVLHERGVPPEAVSILRDALAREPARRFAHAGELAGALREALDAVTARGNRDLAVQFVLRRLQRRPEFPAFSNSIAEINRLTDEQSQASLQDLAAVVMRDFSLTNRLMKVANSAFFARSDSGVTTVLQAISRVGTKTVRLICNGLLMFEHLKGSNPVLQDALVESFVSGLLARLLALQLCREVSDEAFVAAMFNRLGRNLLIYYLEDEYAEVQTRVTQGMPALQAERVILGTTCAEVGAAVAANWKFPAPLISSMAALPPGVVPAPASEPDRMRALAHFANELCSLAATSDHADPAAELAQLGQRYQRVFRTLPTDLATALEVALDKFGDIATSLGIAPEKNGFCCRAREFLVTHQLQQADALQAAGAS
ncbi:MAG: HDOD domain-containing protein [Gammaproteobacteria bacterium]